MSPDIGAFQSQGFAVTAVTPTGPTYRTLIDNLFLKADGATSQQFQTVVSSVAGNEPVVGGKLLYTTSTVSGATGTANPNFIIKSVANSTITFTQPDGLANNTVLIYDDGGGANAPIGGLTEGGSYLALVQANNTIKLATLAGVPITLTSAGTGTNQTLVPAITMPVLAGPGTAQANVLANGTASPAAGTAYTLTVSAGGSNAAKTWSLFNQKTASLSYNVAGGTASKFQPLNAQSGMGADNPTGGGILFEAGAGTTTPTFTVTLMDQESTPQPIVISNQTVSLQVVYKGTAAGTINAITGPNAVTLTTGAGNTASTATASGSATYSDLLVYQSIFNSATSKGYQLAASFKNPDSTVARALDATAFSVLPYELVVTASNFAGFQEKAFNITLATSDRGDIRFVNVTVAGTGGLQTNQVMIRALDFNASGVPQLVHDLQRPDHADRLGRQRQRRPDEQPFPLFDDRRLRGG